MINKTDRNLVYYGPHTCQKCDKNGKKSTLIVRAGNGAPSYLQFDYPKEAEGISTAYPNTHSKLTWKTHKCIDATKKVGRSDKKEKPRKVVANFRTIHGMGDPTPVYRITILKSLKVGDIIELDPTRENENGEMYFY